jgi:2-polyprenyl-3-methyl-5-hydroxy-6-metoxy-1,4-benzoquinol methylase
MEKLKREKSLSNWAEYWESCKGFFDDKSDIEQTEFWDERWQKRKNSISKFHKPGATRSRMNGIFEILDEAGFKIKGSHILDIGSGPGAMSIPFAKAGARVTALDISPKAIEQLQRYAEKNGLDIKGITSSWWTADIDRLGLRNRFDLVFVTRTPAVKDAESLDRMMQCSKAFCFYSFFIQKHGYWHMTDDEVIKNILEKLNL